MTTCSLYPNYHPHPHPHPYPYPLPLPQLISSTQFVPLYLSTSTCSSEIDPASLSKPDSLQHPPSPHNPSLNHLHTPPFLNLHLQNPRQSVNLDDHTTITTSTTTKPQACLLVTCVACNHSSPWFSPLLTPPNSAHLTSSNPSRSPSPLTTTTTTTHLNSSNNLINQSSSLLSNLDPPKLDNHHDPVYQYHHASQSAHHESLHSSAHPFSSPFLNSTAPLWINGHIYALCSSCQHLSHPHLPLASNHQPIKMSSPPHPHPVSFFSDDPPQISPSSSPLHSLDHDDGNLSSSGSSSGSASAPSAKLFRLSFIEPSLRAQDLHHDSTLFSSPHSPHQLETLEKPIPPPSNHVFKFDLAPRRKPLHNRPILSPTTEPKAVLKTVNETLIPFRSISLDAPSSQSDLNQPPFSNLIDLSPPPFNPPPFNLTDRGASLRSLLRQAKIPPPDSDRSSPSHQVHVRTASEIWEAALVATSREPRTKLPPGSSSSHLHCLSEEPDHSLGRVPSSNSSNPSSLQSYPFAPSTSNHSLRIAPDSEIHPTSQTSSLRHPGADVPPIPDQGAAPSASLEWIITPAPLSCLSSESPHNPADDAPPLHPQPQPCQPTIVPPTTSSLHSNLSHSESKVSVLLAPQPPPHHGLLGRFMMGRKDLKRRPNTATGSSSHRTFNNKAIINHHPPSVARPITPPPDPIPPAPTTVLPLSPLLAVPHPIQPTKRPSTAFVPSTSATSSLSPVRPLQRPATATLSSPRPIPHPIRIPPPYLSHQPPPPFTLDGKSNGVTCPKPASRRLSRSVPSTPTAATSSAFLGPPPPSSDQRCPSKLPPEDFYSKSRNLTISISPRPSSDTFRPGQHLTVYVRRNSASARRKYGTIGIVLTGRFVERKTGQTHEFLKVATPVIGAGAPDGSGVRMRLMGTGGDEWILDLVIPEYAMCGCSPGPLPLPSAGISASGEVAYTIQLFAEKKQFITSHESITVKFHLTESVDRRIGGHLTTRPTSVKSSKGRIVFAAGHLGSIEDYSLSHSIYFSRPDRVEIFYAFEVRFGPHSNLPTQLIDQLASSARVELRRLVGQNKSLMKGVIERRAPGWKIIENGWMISGSLEVTDVSAFASPPSPTTSTGTKSRHREKVEQSHRITSQLFLLVTVDDGSGEIGVLGGKKLELSGVIGPGAISDCPLRMLGLRGAIGMGGGRS